MTCGVYSIVDKTTGHKYIGCSRKIEGRWVNHKSAFKRGTSDSRVLQKIFDEKGDVFDYKIILVCREEDRFLYETLCIRGMKPELNVGPFIGEEHPSFGKKRLDMSLKKGEKNHMFGKTGNLHHLYGKKRPDLAEANKIRYMKYWGA